MVEILDETNQLRAVEEIQATLDTLMEELGLADAEATVVILPDEEIHRLNAAHRGVDEPTDVLSYPTHEPDDVGMPEIAHLGDVLIAIGVAARQAEQNDRTLAEEVVVLAAHGITHLRGFDHRDPAEWVPFHEAQRRALQLMRSRGT